MQQELEINCESLKKNIDSRNWLLLLLVMTMMVSRWLLVNSSFLPDDFLVSAALFSCFGDFSFLLSLNDSRSSLPGRLFARRTYTTRLIVAVGCCRRQSTHTERRVWQTRYRRGWWWWRLAVSMVAVVTTTTGGLTARVCVWRKTPKCKPKCMQMQVRQWLSQKKFSVQQIGRVLCGHISAQTAVQSLTGQGQSSRRYDHWHSVWHVDKSSEMTCFGDEITRTCLRRKCEEGAGKGRRMRWRERKWPLRLIATHFLRRWLCLHVYSHGAYACVVKFEFSKKDTNNGFLSNAK